MGDEPMNAIDVLRIIKAEATFAVAAVALLANQLGRDGRLSEVITSGLHVAADQWEAALDQIDAPDRRLLDQVRALLPPSAD